MKFLDRLELALTPSEIRPDYVLPIERTTFSSRPPLWMEIAAIAVMAAFMAGYLAGQVRAAQHIHQNEIERR